MGIAAYTSYKSFSTGKTADDADSYSDAVATLFSDSLGAFATNVQTLLDRCISNIQSNINNNLP